MANFQPLTITLTVAAVVLILETSTRPIVLSNLPQEEKQALQDLRHRTDIIIKPADKGGAVVVWSRDLYNQEAHRELSDNRFYLHLDADPT